MKAILNKSDQAIQSAAPAASARKTQAKVITGEFIMYTYDSTESKTYYYSDDYFSQSGKIENEHLRTMSAAVALTMVGVSKNPSERFGKLPREIGFSDIAAYELDKTGHDTVSLLISRRDIDGTPVILAAIRGDGYGNEWTSSLAAGVQGDPDGFAASAEKVARRVREYIRDNNIEKAKIWVTGFSRGGGVANLFGAALNEDPKGFRTTENDIYVYTFEAPNVSSSPKAYANIRNIINSGDAVTHLLPEGWGFGRNGVVLDIGDPGETIMTKQLTALEPYIEDFKSASLPGFLAECSDLIARAVSREKYADGFQDTAGRLMCLYENLAGAERKALSAFFARLAENIKSDEKLADALGEVFEDAASGQTADDVTGLILRNFEKTTRELGKPVNDEKYELIKNSAEPIVKTVMPVINEDLMTELAGESGEPEEVVLYHVASFAANAGEIFSHHFNNRMFSKLEKLDSFYGQN